MFYAFIATPLLFLIKAGNIRNPWKPICIFVEYISNHPVIDEGTNRMPTVKLKDNEPFDVALRRFKRSCEKAGVLADVRSREFYEKPTAERKRKAAAAVKRHAKKVQREQRRHERLY